LTYDFLLVKNKIKYNLHLVEHFQYSGLYPDFHLLFLNRQWRFRFQGIFLVSCLVQCNFLMEIPVLLVEFINWYIAYRQVFPLKYN